MGRWIGWMVTVLAVVGLPLCVYSSAKWYFNRCADQGVRNYQHQHQHETIGAETMLGVRQALTAKLNSLPEADSISQAFGRFEKLTDYSWSLRGVFQPRVLTFTATAHFEKAQTTITLGVSEDPRSAAEIISLRMFPSPRLNSMDGSPSSISKDQFEVIDNKLCRVYPVREGMRHKQLVGLGGTATRP